MPNKEQFSLRLVAGGKVLPEIKDTATGRTYAVCQAGDEYKIRMSGCGTKVYGAIIQVDGVPATDKFDASPFTYFSKPYDDPGFWTEPSVGKYTPRVFTHPVVSEKVNKATLSAEAASLVGRVRVYFFEVYQVPKLAPGTGKKYHAPKQGTLKETKKWFEVGSTTRYGDETTTGSTGSTYKIKDRSQPLAYVETWYKDTPSLKLLGWDSVATSVELVSPALQAQRKAAEERKRPRTVEDAGTIDDQKEEPQRAKIEVVDLTVDDD